MKPKFNPGEKAFIIEELDSFEIIKAFEEIVKVSGGFYLIKYPDKAGGYRVKESRLYKTEAEAKVAAGK